MLPHIIKETRNRPKGGRGNGRGGGRRIKMRRRKKGGERRIKMRKRKKNKDEEEEEG